MPSLSQLEAAALAAILTPIGQGGIAVLRLIGPDALDLTRQLFKPKSGAWPSPDARRLLYGHIVDGDEIVDEVLLRLVPGNPPWVEIDCHGGVVAVQRVLECFVRRGARAVSAETLIARETRSPIAAEAARALIQATTPLGVEILLDQLDGALERALAELVSALDGTLPPEGFTPSGGYAAGSSEYPPEGLKPSGGTEAFRRLLATERLGRALWQPPTVAIVGPTNAGKSTLFNALAREERMIVSPTPGTTRDAVSAEVAIGGVPVWLTDTAGERDPGSAIEAEAIARGRQAAAAADLALLVVDGSAGSPPPPAFIQPPSPPARILVLNKADLGLAPWTRALDGAICISAERGDGLEVLCERIVAELVGEASRQPGRPVVFTERQATLLRAALEAAAAGRLRSARESLLALNHREEDSERTAATDRSP